MLKRLAQDTGEIVATSARPDDSPSRIVRDCILVHSGPEGEAVELQSSDGPITFDAERIKDVVTNQNLEMGKLGADYGGLDKIPVGAHPPILDQHSDDSSDRVRGRLTGVLRFESRDVPKVGKNVACAVAEITFLGEDTVSRVLDGRLYHLSVGIDEATNTLGEVSCVIEPAAPGAMVLKKGKILAKKNLSAVQNGSVVKSYSVGSAKVQIYKDSSGSFGALVTFSDGKQRSNGQDFRDQAGAESYANQAAKAGPISRNKKGKLMAKKVTRLAKLEAMKGELKQLSEKAAAGKKRVELARRKTEVTGRFVKLMASKKMSPAEYKKIDVMKLAKLAKSDLDTVMEMYEAREALLKSGQQGTVHAANFVDVGTSEEREVARMKAAARKNLSKSGLKFKTLEKGDDKELSLDEPEEKKLEGEVDSSPVAEEAPAETSQLDEVVQMVEENSAQIARISSMVDALMEDAKQDDQEEPAAEEGEENQELEKQSEQSDKAEEDK